MVTKRPPDPEKLRMRMAGLCARSEQCTADIALKLRRAGLDADRAREIIGFLRRERFLDDARYARAFAGDKVRFSAWGRIKIRMALRAKRIPDSVVADAIDAIDPGQYEEALLRAARAKAASLTLSSPADRRRLYLHLASRGFESTLISDAVRRLVHSLQDCQDEEDEED